MAAPFISTNLLAAKLCPILSLRMANGSGSGMRRPMITWSRYVDLSLRLLRTLNTLKVEPARHAYAELNVLSVITGRRASQGAARGSLQPLEIDSTGLFKLNPLYSWNFSAVNDYIQDHNVPHNALLNQGYKSVGDWHSTQKSGDGDSGERAGRWAGNAEKTECGLHEDYFKLRMEMLKKQVRVYFELYRLSELLTVLWRVCSVIATLSRNQILRVAKLPLRRHGQSLPKLLEYCSPLNRFEVNIRRCGASNVSIDAKILYRCSQENKRQ